MSLGKILIISGPPGAGKTTLSRMLAERLDKSLHIPVDDVRLWVVGGLSDTLPEWTQETSRQFELAEDCVAESAKRYSTAGFTVIVDHCRVPSNIDEWTKRCFQGVDIVKVALIPTIETNLDRNRFRKNKDFDPQLLVPVIESVSADYFAANLDSWTVLNNEGSLDSTIERLLVLAKA